MLSNSSKKVSGKRRKKIEFLPTAKERRKVVSQEARKLSRRHKQTKNITIIRSDWYEAEELVDAKILEQDLTPTQAYSALMTKFYSSLLDRRQLSPDEVCSEYIRFLKWNWKFVERANQIGAPQSGSANLRSFSIVSNHFPARNDDPLSAITKRTVLLADSTLITATDGQDYDLEYSSAWYGSSTYSTPVPEQLGEWLISCQGLIERGELLYIPTVLNLHIHNEDPTYNMPAPDEYHRDVQDHWGYTYRTLSSARRASAFADLKFNNSSLVRAIAQVDIPFLDEVDLSHFTKISLDEHDRLNAFRQYLREQFLTLTEMEGDEHYGQHIERIGHKISKDMESLKRDFRLLERKTAVQATSAVVATISAVLVAMHPQLFGQYASLVSAGGASAGLTAFIKLAGDILEKRGNLAEEPMYYFWLLDRG